MSGIEDLPMRDDGSYVRNEVGARIRTAKGLLASSSSSSVSGATRLLLDAELSPGVLPRSILKARIMLLDAELSSGVKLRFLPQLLIRSRLLNVL